MSKQLWVISPGNDDTIKCVVWAGGREDAKRKAAAGWLSGSGDPDRYICTPITNPGDTVGFNITL